MSYDGILFLIIFYEIIFTFYIGKWCSFIF